jgi:predicted Zn finger-like uncharacterized protein
MKISCPACEALFSLPESALGRPLKCSKCGHKFELASNPQPTTSPPLGIPAASGDPLPIDRVSGGLAALGTFVGFLVALHLLGAGVIAAQDDNGKAIVPAIIVACGVIPLWLWWVSVSLTVRLLVQIERNTRRR